MIVDDFVSCSPIGRRGVYPNRTHHGRTQAAANGKDDSGTSAQKRIRNLQQKVLVIADLSDL